MEPHRIVSQDEWLAARKAHLAEEKAFSKARDALSKKRRELPWVKVDKTYVFDGPNGKETLADMFGGRSQLIVYHFMLGPDWEAGCPSCSFLADHIDGAVPHLAHRDVTLTAVARAPLRRIEAFKARMGWRFKWVSSYGSDFNFDYRVSFDAQSEIADSGEVDVQLRDARQCLSEERPGASVFYKNDKGEIFHTYSSYGRGLDMLIGAYHMLDLAPKGRDEQNLAWPMAWVRHHDRYDGAAIDGKAQYVEPKKSDSCCD